MTISPARFPAVTVTVVRDRKFRTALRTNQIAGFVTVPSWKKINHIILSLSSFSLETAVALLQESYTVKKEMLRDRKENGKCTNVTNHTGVGGDLSAPFSTDTVLFFWTGTVLPCARYASTQQTSRSRKQSLFSLYCIAYYTLSLL